MPQKVRIPTPLRKLTNNEELVETNAATIGDAIKELQARFPGIAERLVDEKGEVRRFVNVCVNAMTSAFCNRSAAENLKRFGRTDCRSISEFCGETG